MSAEDVEMDGLLEIAGTDLEAGGSGAVLLRVFQTLDRAGLPYCVLDSYEGYPASGPSGDVDCVMPVGVLPLRLATVLRANRDRIGAEVVQWNSESDHYVTLTFKGSDGRPRFLHLDVHPG